MSTKKHVFKHVSKKGKGITLKIRDDFTLAIHNEFREAYINEAKDSKFIIDFSQTEMIDSSGLSLLILLLDFSESGSKSIILKGCNPRVSEVLKTASFDQLFQIEKISIWEKICQIRL